MSVWKKQTSRDSDKAIQAVFPSMNAKPLDVVYENNNTNIATESALKKSYTLAFAKQLPRTTWAPSKMHANKQKIWNSQSSRMKSSNLTLHIEPTEERKMREQEERSYDAVLRATDHFIAKPTGASSSPKNVSKGTVLFDKMPNRNSHFLSKFDGPIGMRNNSDIDYIYSKIPLDLQKCNTLDLKKQSPRKPQKLNIAAPLTYFDVKTPKSHISSVNIQKMSTRQEKYAWLQYNEVEGDPGKYLPNDEMHSRKGQKPKLIPNFAKETNRSKVKHLHPRVNIMDLSYSIPSSFGFKGKGAPDIFLSTSRGTDAGNVVKSVDTLLTQIERELATLNYQRTI